jgi:hypothetical protein
MCQTSRYWLFIVIVAMAALFAGAGPALAGFTLDLEVRETYEDNVIGLVADNPNIISNPAAAAAEGAATGATGGDTGGRGGQGGGGRTLHMRKGGGELNDIPTTVTGPTTTTTTATTSAAAGASGGTITAGDFSTSIGVEAGYLHDLGDITTLLFLASVDHTGYSRYTQFNFTIASLRAGVSVDLTDDLTGKVLVGESVKRFNNSSRNANAFGASFSLKERLTPSFWVKGIYSFEQNNADSFLDSYTGNSYSIWAGYHLTAKTSVGAGYSYLTRDFKSSQFRLISKTASADFTWDFYKNWSVNVGFDHERGDSNAPNSATIDNIYSVGLLYSY